MLNVFWDFYKPHPTKIKTFGIKLTCFFYFLFRFKEYSFFVIFKKCI